MTAWDEKTVLSVPLAFRGEPVGILRLYDMVEERPFEPEEIELISSMESSPARPCTTPGCTAPARTSVRGCSGCSTRAVL